MSHDLATRVGVDLRSGAGQAVRLAGPLVIASVLLGTAAAQGGYFPTSWGWAGLGLAWPLGVAIVLSGGYPPMSRVAAAYLIAISGLLLWIALSCFWSVQPWESALEAERVLIYVLGAAFVLLVARRADGGVYRAILLAIVAVAAYGLGTRLFPDRLGVVDPIANYRLAEPIGYWNGLAVFAAMGTLLAIGTAINGRSSILSGGSAAALPLLVVTQYFAFSRASWIALAGGLLIAIVVDTRRLRFVTHVLALSVPSIAAMLIASRQTPLTHIGAPLPEATHSGHRFALILIAFIALSGAVGVAAALAERTISIAPRLRQAYAVLLAAAAATCMLAVFVAAGSPWSLASRAYDSFTSTAYVPPETAGNATNLDTRLFSFSGNGRAQFWRVAWAEYRSNPWLGSGSGTFQSFWLPKPKVAVPVHDAHGLYIETLAELGPIGLALILSLVALPLIAAAGARRSPLTAGATGAYLAFFIHAGVDWDWELGGVTLVAVSCGALLVSLRPRQIDTPPRRFGTIAALGVLVPLTLFAFVATFGNSSLAGSKSALRKQDWPRAEQLARRASRWTPWSPEPWTALGEAQLGAGDRISARVSFRRALTHGRDDWEAWLGLARATSGATRASALAEARRLNARLEPL